MDLTKLIAVVRTAAEAFVPGAAPAIAAAQAVVDYAKSVRPTLDSNDQDRLDNALEPLLARMNRNVDQAIADLGGKA